jgi:hypothetical protein
MIPEFGMRRKRIFFACGLTCAASLALLAGASRAEDVVARPALSIVKAAANEGPESSQFTLDGLVVTPATYDRAALAALPQSSLKVGDITYTGVSLWTLLNKAGIIIHPDIKNDILREIVVATASDGYKVAISLGEIDPDFGNQPCLIAAKRDGADFASGGIARLIFPNDVKKGRWVINLTELKVLEGP